MRTTPVKSVLSYWSPDRARLYLVSSSSPAVPELEVSLTLSGTGRRPSVLRASVTWWLSRRKSLVRRCWWWPILLETEAAWLSSPSRRPWRDWACPGRGASNLTRLGCSENSLRSWTMTSYTAGC